LKARRWSRQKIIARVEACISGFSHSSETGFVVRTPSDKTPYAGGVVLDPNGQYSRRRADEWIKARDRPDTLIFASSEIGLRGFVPIRMLFEPNRF